MQYDAISLQQTVETLEDNHLTKAYAYVTDSFDEEATWGEEQNSRPANPDKKSWRIQQIQLRDRQTGAVTFQADTIHTQRGKLKVYRSLDAVVNELRLRLGKSAVTLIVS